MLDPRRCREVGQLGQQGRRRLFNSGSGVQVIDSTVSENSAGRDGGGTFNTSLANLTLTDVHLAHNVAGQNGGGLYNAGSASIGSSIFSGNKAAKKQRKKVPDTFFGPGRAIKQTGRSVHHRLG